MDSVQHTNISNKKKKDTQLINNNKQHLDNSFNTAGQENYEPKRNNSINSLNKNNTGNFKIINLKQKLQDQILFGNERKHGHLAANIAQQRSRPKNYETHNPVTRNSKDKYPPNNRNAGQSIISAKNIRSNSVHKGTLPAKKTIMSNLSTINMHKADHNISNYNNFNVSAKKGEKPMKYNFDNEIVSFNNFLAKKLTSNASSSNIYGANSKFKKPFKLLDEIKVKIDELSLTSSHDQHLQQQQNQNKTFQNFSKSKHILENMIENLREELAGISKISTQEKQEQQNKESFMNENSSLPISDVILSLQAKNDELSKQLQNFKEKFVDINLENVSLRNKLKENSSINRRSENLNFSSNLPIGTGASESTTNKNRMKIKSASKEKTVNNANLHKLNNSPTIISLNLKTHGNNNLDAVKKLAEKVKEKELELAEIDDKVKNITFEYKQAEKNLLKAENKIESLQKIISEVLAKSKKDQNTIESLKQQIANLSASAKDLSNLNNNKSNYANQLINTDSNLNNLTNISVANNNNNKLFDYKNQEVLIHLNYKINKQNDFILISDAEQLKYAWINLYNKENNAFSEAIDYYNNIYNQILSNNNFSEEPESYDNLVDYVPDFQNLNLNPNQSFSKTKSGNTNNNNNIYFNKKIRFIFQNLDLELDKETNFSNIKPVYLPIEDSKEYLSQAYKFNLACVGKESVPPAIPKASSASNNNLNNSNAIIKIKESEIESLKKDKENLEKEFNESRNYLFAELESRENLIANLKSDLEKLLNDNSNFIENVEKLNAELDEKNKILEDLINENKTSEAKISHLAAENKTLLESKNIKSKDAVAEINFLKNEIEKLNSQYASDLNSYENTFANLKQKLKDSEEEISECKSEIEKLKKAETKISNTNLFFKENLNKELESKQSEINHLHAEIELLSKDNSSKLSELKKLKSDLETIQTESAAKQSQINNLSAENENLKTAESENAEIIKKLKLNLSQRDAEILNVNIENKNLKNKLAEKAKALTSMQADFSALQQENAEKEKLALTQNSNLSNTLISFNNQIAGLMSQIKELEEENVSLKNSKSNGAEEKENLEIDLGQKKTQIKNLKQVLHEKENKISALAESEQKNFDKLEKFKVEIDEFKRLVSKKDMELENFVEQINSVNEILSENELLISELKKQINENNENYASEKLQIEERINLLNTESEEINEKNKNFESEIKKLKEDLAKKAKEIILLKELCDAKSHEVSSIKEDLKNIKNAGEANKSQNSNNLTSLKEENNLLKSEIESLNKKLTEFDKLLEHLNVEKQSDLALIKHSEKALQEKTDEFNLLINKLRQYEKDLVSLQDVAQEKEKEIEKLKKEITQQKENNEILNSEITERDNKIDSLEKELAEASENLRFLSEQMKQSEAQISDLASELQQKRVEFTPFESHIENLNKKLSEKEFEIKAKADLIGNLNKELSEWKKEFKNIQDENIIMNAKLKDFEKLVQQNEKAIAELNAHKANFETNLSQSSHRANEDFTTFKYECDEKFKLIEAENNELEELILTYNQEIKVLKNQNDNFKKFEKENLDLLKVVQIQEYEINKNSSEINTLTNKLKELEKLNDHLESNVNNLKAELDGVSKSSSHRESDKDRKFEKLQKEKEISQAELNDVKKSYEHKLSELNSNLNAEMNDFKKDCEHNLLEGRKEIENLNKVKADCEEKIQKLKKELEMCKTELQGKAKSYVDEFSKSKEQIEALEAELANRQNDFEKVDEELQGKNETLNALSELINEKICILNTYEEENESLKAEILSLKKNLAEKEEDLKNNTQNQNNENKTSNTNNPNNNNLNTPITNNNNTSKNPNNNNNNSLYQNTKSENTYDSILITDPTTTQAEPTSKSENIIANYEEKIEKLNKANKELNNQILLLTMELQRSCNPNFNEKSFPVLITKEKENKENVKEIARLKEDIDKYDLENNQLKGLISDYEKCIEELQDKIADFSQNINKTNSELEEKLAEKENENLILIEKLNIYEYGLNDYKEKEKYFLEQISKLADEKKMKEKEMEKYIAAANNNNNNSKNKQAENNNVNNINNNLIEEMKNLESLLEEKDKEIYELREALEIYDQKLSELESLKDKEGVSANDDENENEESEKVQVYKEQIDSLKTLIKQKDLKINELTKEIEYTKFEFDKYLKTNEDDNKSRISFNISSTEPNDERRQAERLEKYKSAAQNYKQNNELLMSQLTLLKDEIKQQKAKNEFLLNFDGRIKDYDEFKNLFSCSTENYKPKKKEQEEALKKLKEHLAINLNVIGGTSQLLTDNSSVINEKKKSGLLGFFSKKK